MVNFWAARLKDLELLGTFFADRHDGIEFQAHLPHLQFLHRLEHLNFHKLPEKDCALVRLVFKRINKCHLSVLFLTS